jgi:diguanylate cyclase (GGDEF)-like protein
VDGSSAGSVAERLRSHLAANPTQVAGLTIVVTCSLGVAVSTSHGSKELEMLIRNADRALYRAKEAGRNRVELAF